MAGHVLIKLVKCEPSGFEVGCQLDTTAAGTSGTTEKVHVGQVALHVIGGHIKAHGFRIGF